MNEKGMTIVELIVSFALTVVIALFLTEIVLFLRETYVNNGIKTEIVNKQTLISDRIYSLLNTKKIISAKSCGTKCTELTFDDGVISQIAFNDNKVVVGDYVTELPKGCQIGDILAITQNFDNTNNYNSIFQIYVPITSSMIKNKSFDINVIYQYNNTDNWSYSALNIDEKVMPIKREYGATWVRIFYHNNRTGTVLFNSDDQVLNTFSNDKQSILYALDKFIGDDNKYEFLLQYPEISTTLYNRWKQSNKPQDDTTDITANGSSVTGYEAINISWTSSYWGGLTKSTGNNYTFIDGSVANGSWFYAIGCKVIWSGGIPGPSSPAITGATELWIRIDDYLDRLLSS